MRAGKLKYCTGFSDKLGVWVSTKLWVRVKLWIFMGLWFRWEYGSVRNCGSEWNFGLWVSVGLWVNVGLSMRNYWWVWDWQWGTLHQCGTIVNEELWMGQCGTVNDELWVSVGPPKWLWLCVNQRMDWEPFKDVNFETIFSPFTGQEITGIFTYPALVTVSPWLNSYGEIEKKSKVVPPRESNWPEDIPNIVERYTDWQKNLTTWGAQTFHLYSMWFKF